MDFDNTVIETPLFPKKFYTKTKYRKKALLGLGSNIDNPMRILKKALLFLLHDKKIAPLQSFYILKNPPFGYIEQPYFYNTAVTVQTNLAPKALLRRTMWIEKRFGRKRSFKNAPRTLDIDIIFFENIVMYNNELSLPHPHWRQRGSVIVPISHNRSKLKWKK